MAAFWAKLNSSTFCKVYTFFVFFSFIFIFTIFRWQKWFPNNFLHISTNFPIFTKFFQYISYNLFIFFLINRTCRITYISYCWRIIKGMSQYFKLKFGKVYYTLHLILGCFMFQCTFRFFLAMKSHSTSRTTWITNDNFNFSILFHF